MATERRRAEYDELDRKEARRKHKPEKIEKTLTELEELERKEKQLRTRVKELEDKRAEAPHGTTMWNDKGEQVSTFQLEDNRMWMIVRKTGDYTALHCFQTERICFIHLIDTIRKDELKEAVILSTEDKKFMLKHISWEEIAKRAIRQEVS